MFRGPGWLFQTRLRRRRRRHYPAKGAASRTPVVMERTRDVGWMLKIDVPERKRFDGQEVQGPP